MLTACYTRQVHSCQCNLLNPQQLIQVSLQMQGIFLYGFSENIISYLNSKNLKTSVGGLVVVNLCPHIFITTETCDRIFNIQQGQRGLTSLTGEKLNVKIHAETPKQLHASQLISILLSGTRWGYSSLRSCANWFSQQPAFSNKTQKYVMNQLVHCVFPSLPFLAFPCHFQHMLKNCPLFADIPGSWQYYDTMILSFVLIQIFLCPVQDQETI